jgi:8-oxo-dGTP pyrophosphatase MutT (NUDIX family)
MEKIQELNAYLVVECKDKVLMLKRFNGFWEFPGGGVDFGEEPRTTAIREYLEETGIKIDESDVEDTPFCVSSAVYEKDGKKKHSIYIVYLAKIKKEIIPKLSREHVSFCWCKKNELKSLTPLAKNAEKVITFLLRDEQQ